MPLLGTWSCFVSEFCYTDKPALPCSSPGWIPTHAGCVNHKIQTILYCELKKLTCSLVVRHLNTVYVVLPSLFFVKRRRQNQKQMCISLVAAKTYDKLYIRCIIYVRFGVNAGPPIHFNGGRPYCLCDASCRGYEKRQLLEKRSLINHLSGDQTCSKND